MRQALLWRTEIIERPLDQLCKLVSCSVWCGKFSKGMAFSL